MQKQKRKKCYLCKQLTPLQDLKKIAWTVAGVPSGIIEVCPSCAIKVAPNPQPSQQANPIVRMRPQMNLAICPRCGEAFAPDIPIKQCPECSLEIGQVNEDGEIEWNERMMQPIPSFVNSSLAPEEIFAKSLRWHYNYLVRPFKNNPSSKHGKA